METKLNSNIISRQIGCGYCIHETPCKSKVKGRNKAAEGCNDFKHYTTVDLKILEGAEVDRQTINKLYKI